ncbi:bolA-like protein DDB_G0274169 [Onthophagus taurus]|uniref:bolA-like protein DDB_G0274169 n=1 Tax=Onthophagus taurus TaxID=166361 RepID=UPI000C203451|nr:bolA-like protein DDB_G0274169 [Onthophagus taurus]
MNRISSKIFKFYPKNTTERSLKMVSNPIETSIREKLSSEFAPKHLEVINESPMHNVPKGSESHFKVLVVSEKFMNVPLIMRHRMVNDALREELTQGLHALSIQAKTPDQWKPSDVVEPSPNCRGGFGK